MTEPKKPYLITETRVYRVKAHSKAEAVGVWDAMDFDDDWIEHDVLVELET